MQFRALLITALLLSSSLSVKIFLFGGILVADNNPAYAKLAEQTGKPTRKNCNQNWDTTDCPRVAVVTSACEDSQCGYEEYYQGDGEQVATGQFFIDLGMVPRHISVQIDNYEEATNFFNSQGFQYLQWLNQADVIYFNGGDQSRHVRCWFNDNGTPNPFFSVIRQRVLNNQVILVGVSAGTAVQSKYTFGGGSSFGILYFTNSPGLAPLPISLNQGLYDFRNGTDCLQYSQNGGYLPGFGFIDFQVDTHFDRRGRLGRLIPALAQLNQTIGVGIDQYACLYYKDGVGTVYGSNGAFVADITGVSKLKSSYFQIKNAKLHYLTAGDSFDFKTKKMSTKKAAISAPSQNGFADSDNILAKYECTRLVARLVDQRGSENLGRTVVPAGEDYPQGTPTFDLLFYKNAQTKGYKSGGAISAENVSVDYSAEVRASA